jgi:recombination protein RecA
MAAAPKKKTSSILKPAASLKSLREQMTKTYGEGRVTRRDSVKKYEVISTGSLSLDHAMRVGGWVRGRTHEIIGVEGVGKTTVTITSMAEAQRTYPDEVVGYIDMEQTFDFDWAAANGLDTSDDRFIHVFPDDTEQVSDMLRQMCQTGLFSMLVVDSIGGMESKQAFEKGADEAVMGRNAQAITRMVKHVATLARTHNVAIVFVNQYRANLSGMGSDISAGPKALRYNTTMKVEMRRTGEPTLKVGKGADEEEVGRQVRAKVSRSKVAAQGKSAEFWIINQPTEEYGPIGIDQADEAVVIGDIAGIFGRRGSWYDLPDGTSHNGKDAVKTHLRANPEELQRIRKLALEKVSDEVTDEVETTFENEETA